MDPISISILSCSPECYSTRRLIEAATQRGHKVEVINTLRCTIGLDHGEPEMYYKGEELDLPDAVLPRIGTSITRYGTAYAPMDETLTRCALDISGRPYFVWKVSLGMPRLGEWDTELIEHWFHSFATSAGITLHIENLYGSNNHHIVESCYKALARALRQAVEIDPRKADAIPSTKGTL